MGDLQTSADRKIPAKEKLGRIAEILDRSGIDIEDVGRIEKVRLGEHQVAIKTRNAEGIDEVTVHDLQADSLVMVPTWADGPEWPVVQPATPAKITYGRRPKGTSDGLTRWVIFPDPQIGFWRNLDTGDLYPMHDPRAVDCAFQVARAVNPTGALWLGDFIDLAEFSSKFAVYPEFALTTQAAIDYGHNLLAQSRAIVGPDGDLVLIAGNHDDRLGKAVLKNAMAALRLRRADAPESWPAMSVPNLLALDALDCQYVDGYPAGSYKLADGTGSQTPLYAVHERGLDVAKVAKQQRQSYVQGHMHRVAMHSETYELNDQPIDVEAWSLGSLCRRDGFVPSTKGAPNDRGIPVPRVESWQQAVGVVTIEPSGAWEVEAVRIRNGRAIWGGKVYEAS